MAQYNVRVFAGVEWVLLACFSALLAAHTLPRAWCTLDTDFPNYYLTAQLADQRYDASRAYDWRWLQREKDHRGIDQRVIGLAPITPFSTLFVWPLSRLRPLAAKHVWLVLQVALLVPITLGLRSLTGQPLRRIWLLTVACLPLHRNLMYGQFYILLLGMLVAACWAYRRGLSALAGTLVAIAAMTKIFPAVLLLYFVRKRDWRALAAATVTVAVCAAISVSVFGWSMHRHYVEVVLPWTLRGEVLPPYTLAGSSLASVLHRLFVYEPQWNPHPWHNAPAVAAVLGPLLQTMLLAPALLLLKPDDRTSAPIEWSALLCATLAVSTVPASYNFTLLIFPLTVLCERLLPRSAGLAVGAVLLFFGIGYPGWDTGSVDGVRAILHVPRLYLLVALTALCCWTMVRGSLRVRLLRASNVGWSGAFAVVVVGSIFSGLRHQHGLYADYAYRLPMRADALLSADPTFTAAGVEAITLLPQGYQLKAIPLFDTLPGTSTFAPIGKGGDDLRDQLSFAHGVAGDWIEEVGGLSRIVPPRGAAFPVVEDARSPVLSVHGTRLVYVREDRGRGRLFQRWLGSPTEPETTLTPGWMNVLEAAPLAGGSTLVASYAGAGLAGIYVVQPGAEPRLLPLGEARYPAVSPDGRWLAYSHFHSGSWNLWLLDLETSATRRLAEVDCNQVEPAWEPDSKTILYASDCGRALGFTAICRRRVVK